MYMDAHGHDYGKTQCLGDIYKYLKDIKERYTFSIQEKYTCSILIKGE